MMLEKKTSGDIEYFCYKNRTTKLYKGFKKKDFENKVWVSQESELEFLEKLSKRLNVFAKSHLVDSPKEFNKTIVYFLNSHIKELKGEKE